MFYPEPEERNPRYYLRGEVLNLEEDQNHEFKGHRNISIPEVPPWCVNSRHNTRTRNAACRNLCGFLNTGMGGTLYIGILDGGKVEGVRLTQYQMDHLLLSLHDSLGNFSPPVPRFMYTTEFIPVLDPGDSYPTQFFQVNETVRNEPHYIRSHLFCWCDYDSLGQFRNGIIPLAFVVEIRVPPVDTSDPRIQALIPGVKRPCRPVFQCEDGQVYFRKHSSIVMYSMTDIIEQAREEVHLMMLSKLITAWKRWKTFTRLREVVTKALAKYEQECIKPVKVEKTRTGTGAKIKIQDDGSYVQLREGGEVQKLQKVEISLTDCLACSGCITSAESVLITQQSQEEMLRVFQENKQLHQDGKSESAKLIVVSLSVQPVLSLAARYNLSPDEAAQKLSGYLRNLGADLVVDMSVADDFALLESHREFVERFRASDDKEKPLPMLASSCPGWVCYAEKTHGNLVLPHISTTKSPQQIMGSLVKYHLAPQMGRTPDSVYHVTLMPCYDKKLEASREDFFNQQLNTRDVDCVVTAIELEQLLQMEGVDLASVNPVPLDFPWSKEHTCAPPLRSHQGSGSGGYADLIFLHAARELFGNSHPDLQYRSLRNPDFREVTLEEDGKVLLRFAIANGFRNIQNLVQKMKRGKSAYHYVEVMACPSGCLNGGAQVRPQDGSSPRELTCKLESTYQSLPKQVPEENKVVEELYNSWLGGAHSDKAASLLHTKYHAVEKMATALNIKW